jgi:hypothetical protein
MISCKSIARTRIALMARVLYKVIKHAENIRVLAYYFKLFKHVKFTGEKIGVSELIPSSSISEISVFVFLRLNVLDST